VLGGRGCHWLSSKKARGTCGGATPWLQEESPGSKPPFKMANALSSSYQCASIGFRQMVPPLPTSDSHPAASSSRFTSPSTDKDGLFGLETPISANVVHLLICFG